LRARKPCRRMIAAGREHGYHGPMLMLEWILVLLLAAVVLTNVAERLAVPYPSLLAIAAAFDTSPRGLP
jgi:hypothetical protein